MSSHSNSFESYTPENDKDIVNTMTADALVRKGARTSAANIVT